MREIKLKLDLHTHCLEATKFAPLDVKVVGKIIAAAKTKGLDGIAITEHDNKDYAYQVKEIVERFFDNEILIIPGQELEDFRRIPFHHIIELYLPNNSTFRFIAHPTIWELSGSNFDNIHGLEVENGNHHLDKEGI